MKKIILIISLLLIRNICFASSSAEHHQDGIPTVVWWQFANVIVLFGGLYYLTKESAKEFFKTRKEKFEDQAEKSQAVKIEAEAQYADIKNRLDQLTLSADESVQRAKAEAADMRRQMLADAELIAQRLKDDAKKTAEIEASKAVNKLRDQLVADSISAATTLLAKDVSQNDHNKLQSNFSKEIGV